MSSPDFPALPSTIQHQKHGASPEKSGLRAEIIQLSPDIKNRTDAGKDSLRIEGRVIERRDDGRFTIRTDRGDIELRTDQIRTIPREGARIEITVSRDGAQARIYTETERQLPQGATRHTTTPVQVDIQTDAEQPRTQKPLVTTAPPTTVRIEPLPLQEALPYIAEPLQTLPQTLNTPPTLPLREVSFNNLNSLLLSEPTSTLLNAEPVLNAIFQPSPQNFTAALTTPTAPNQRNQQPTAFLNLFAATQTPLILSPPSEGLQPLASLPPLTQAGEVKIDTISLPQISILPPNAQTEFAPFELIKHKIEHHFTPIKTDMIATDHSAQYILTPKQATEMQALLIGHTNEKLPVIALPTFDAGGLMSDPLLFTLHQPQATVTPDSVITLTPVTLPVTAQTATPTMQLAEMNVPQLANFFATPETWQLMQELQQALIQVAPRAAQAMASMTPSPTTPAQFGGTALFFIAALKGGDLQQWLGDKAVEALKKAGKGILLTRLGQEGNALARLGAEPATQDWRSLSLPLYYEQEFQKIALHYRHEKDPENPDDPRGKQVRFIFDLSLDAMGNVQLDGLFRAPRLDLIVRTTQAFSSAMQQEMRRAYVSALEQTRVTGELSFQNKLEQWVKINRDDAGFGVNA